MTRIDRRALFTSGAAAALLAASGVSLLAAPSAGGRLRLAVPRDTGSLENAARGAVFDTLTEIAPDGALRGELATGWIASNDARVWTFDLRPDVVFHDGSAFGAADVIASLSQHRDTGLDLKAEALGTHQIRLELAVGNPDLPFMLANPELIICQAASTPDNAIGTGVYRSHRFQADRHFLGQRVGNHYKDGRAGWVDAFEIVVIPDAAVRAEALRDGFVDVAELPLPDGLRGRGEFHYHPSAKHMALASHRGVGVPQVISARATLDDMRIAERWWMLASK